MADRGQLLRALGGLIRRALDAAGVEAPAPVSPPAAAVAPTHPETGEWTSFARYVRGGWRSAAAWVCVAVLIINGAVLPMARLFGFAGEAIDWPGLATFVAGLVALTHYRSKDLEKGVTS